MKPPFPSLTAEWHNTSYAAIAPSNPSLSAAGKTVIVTGAGVGIGREIAKAYAEAGAAHVAILGRTQKTLDETKDIINKESPDTKVTIHIADVADESAVGKAAAEVKGWDVLILNAGIASKPGPLAKADLGDWWRVLETNVRGCVVPIQAFLPSRKPSASIIGINAGLIQVPPGVGPTIGVSAYSSSKMAQLRLMEFLAAEEPDVYVASVHPGVVVTDMGKQWGADASSEMREGAPPLDDVTLPAHFLLWMTSPEATFLRGRFVWVNWDVEQLKAKADEIQNSQMLTSHDLGLTFVPKPLPGH